jgi:hypothetical protein
MMKKNSDKGMRFHKTRSSLEKLNKDFYELKIIGNSFYGQLSDNNVDVWKSVLVCIAPDGDNTFIGTLIRQDGKVFEFDLDIEDPVYSNWTEISEQFFEVLEKNLNSKPWSDDVVAYQLFKEMSKS